MAAKMGSDRLSAIMVVTFVVVICGAGLAEAFCDNRHRDSCPWRAHSSRSCSQGHCVYTCDSGWKNCDGRAENGCEADCGKDVKNCGDCGQQCHPKPHSDAVCNNGHCDKVCQMGWFDCDKNPENGCETDCSSNVNQCGHCNMKCPTMAHGEPTCSKGQCGMKCTGYWRDCDHKSANGCEMDCSQDIDNCGDCGHKCPYPHNDEFAERTCSNGQCGMKCKPGCKWNDKYKKCEKTHW